MVEVPDLAVPEPKVNLDQDVRRSDDHSLDLPVDVDQTLDQLAGKVRLAAKFQVEAESVALLAREVSEVLDQADLLQAVHNPDLSVFRVAANLDQDAQVVMAILDQDVLVDREIRQMEVRCNTRFLFLRVP